MLTTPPMFAGGQGRGPQDMHDSAIVLSFLALVALLLAVVFAVKKLTG